jgi:hypothetical protein
MKNLQLSLKKKWFDMTASGEKSEDYREINEYWFNRLFADIDKEDMPIILQRLNNGWSIERIEEFYLHCLKPFTQNTMTLGYPVKCDKDKTLVFKHAGIHIGEGKPEWGAEAGKLYFVIKHGERLQ